MGRTIIKPVLAMIIVVIAGCDTKPGSGDGGNVQHKKPNILFISVDDLRTQLKCYGQEQMITPNIDRLAADGILFENAFCQVPVCGASRASLLTGIRPTRFRFRYYATRADEDVPGVITLPSYLKDHGYYTISNGKIFQHPGDCADYSWSEQVWRRPDDPKYLGWQAYITDESKRIIERNQEKYHRPDLVKGPAWENPDVPDDAYPDGNVAEKTIKDLRRLKQMDRPFFLAVGFYKPHLPFNVPKKYWDMYAPHDIHLADNPYKPVDAPDAAMHNSVGLRSYDNIPEKGPVSEDLARKLVHGYYAVTTYTDTQIGKVLNALDALGLRDNTIVILWGDHGYHLGEHTLWTKHCTYDKVARVPLIVSAPGFEHGIRTEALTEFVDIFPSICELADLPLPEHSQLQGTSFVPLMKDPDLPWKKAVLTRFFDASSIRTERYRYTEWTGSSHNGPPGSYKKYARMLTDLEQDPDENVNIAEHPENRELVEALSKMLREGWESYVPEK